MAAAPRVAVVTGANKGIGFHVAKQLCDSGSFSHVVLACRDLALAATAAKEMGPAACVVGRLDLGDPTTFKPFADTLAEKFGKVEVLVNNAAIAFKAADPTPFQEQTGITLTINFYRTLDFTDTMLPLLKAAGKSARLVNVASMAGLLTQVQPPLQAKFTDPALTLTALRELMQTFEKDVAAGTHKAAGWSNSNYGMSKLALIAATRVLARENPDMRVNCCCPGYCSTDMSSHKGPRPASEGARNATLLVEVKDDGPTGEFLQNGAITKWESISWGA